MCGILGGIFYRRDHCWQETHRILEHLFKASEVRGKDSTGLVARLNPSKGTLGPRSIVIKEAVPATKFVESNSAWRALRHHRCSIVLAHVRWATHGPITQQYAHPHSSGHLHLVHNGIVSEYLDLIDRYALKVETQGSDSEVLLRIIERAKTPAIGLSLCLIERPGAIVVYDERRDCLWLAHDESRPLWVCRMKNDRRLFFGSTSGILVEGIQDALQTSVTFDLLMPLATDHIFCASSASGSIYASFEDPILPMVLGQ